MPALSRAAALGILLAAYACGATAGETPLYRGLEPDRFMADWLVLGPIPIADGPEPDDEEQQAAFARDLLAAAGGEASVSAQAGTNAFVDGASYEWRLVKSASDIIDLKIAETPEAFSVAYAWADIHVAEEMTGVLGIGSDDAVKVWLNGRLIHEHWIGRAPRPDDDLVPVAFERGRNRLLLKVQNIQGPWGFVCRLLGPDAKAAKLLSAARAGDLAAATLLLDHGADADNRAPRGLTALQAATLSGQMRMVELLASRGADASAPMPPPDQLTDALFTGLFTSDGAGAAVLVAKDGNILFERGYGLGNVERRIAVEPTTRFRIGSITKQFTAAAILKLAEEGKLSVDDTLSTFIPDYPRGDEVTIEHLLTHTSGIHSYTNKPGFVAGVTKAIEPEALIHSFKGDPYDFDPGERWAYNNSGYFLLGHIIEQVSGQSYGEYLRETFFEPLGMNDTGVHEATGTMPREALGYTFDGGRFTKAVEWNMSWAGAAGALYSTVGDLHRWNDAVFGGRVLESVTLEAAFTPVKTKDDDPAAPKDAGYGYGWSIQEFRGQRELSHGGGLHGFVSYLLRLPDEALTVAVLVNAAPPPPDAAPGALARDVVELYLGEQLAPRETPEVDTTVASGALDAVLGRYDYGAAILTVTRHGDRLFAQLSGQPRFEIYPKSETTFFWKVVEAEVTFVENEAGEVTRAVHKQGGQTIAAPKIE